MHRFRILLIQFKEKFIYPWKYALPFAPMIAIYVFLLRPVMARSIFSPFIWLADLLVFGLPFGICLGFMVGKRVGGGLGDTIFYPKQHLRTPPIVLSPIKGMIALQEYDEAIEELEEILKEKPFTPEPYLLLVKIYANELNDYHQAMKLIEDYFYRNKVYVFDENVEMLMIYADMCAEYNYLNRAAKILAQEVERKGYSEEKRKHFKTRLEAIIEKNNAL
jgi:tetratricopeptide (TPR) repeat protein